MSKTYRSNGIVFNDEMKDYAHKIQGIRRSNAAGFHGDRRTKRTRTRGDQLRVAIRESYETA